MQIYAAVLGLCAAMAVGCSDDELNGDSPDAGPGDVGDADADRAGECALTFEDTGQSRVFAFGSKIAMDVAESYQTYEAYFRGQVDEIADCLSDERPNLLLFPEDAGLHAGLIGSRGAQARAATGTEDAFAQLMLAYDDTIGYVDEQYDDLDLPRLIFLGLTDTVWRAMDQTFSGIADDYDAWVLTSGNVARVEETTDDEMIELWADPDLEDVESVYIPTGEHVYNSAIIYDPDGERVDRVHKPYLTETEEQELALSYGSTDEVRPVTMGPERLGVFTSKDAWMPPMNDRLGLLGATLQVQPEAFSGWTISQLDDQHEWLPDVITQSGWAAVQKYASFRYGAMPVLTGNFVDMSFDGQPVVWGQAHPGVEWGGFVGQYDRPGFLEVGPWAFDDPGDEQDELTLEQRRDELRDLGEAMLPGAGDPHENAYVDGVVARDLSPELDYAVDDDARRADEVDVIDAVDARGALPPEGPIQRVRVDARNPRLAINWQEQRDDDLVVYRSLWERSDDTFELESDSITASTAPAGKMVAPAVAMVDDGRMLSVFQRVDPYADPHVTESSLQARIEPGEDGSVDSADLSSIEEQSDTWLADVAADGERVALVYTDDERDFERVYLSMSDDGGYSFGEPRLVDAEPDFEPPNTRGNQWHPTVDIHGDTIAVVWSDFRDFQWDLYGTYSLDGGDTWSDAIRIDGAGDNYERLHTDPRVVLVDEQEAIVAWSYQAERRPDTDARYRRWNLVDDVLEDTVVLNRQAQTYPTHAWLPAVAPVADGDEVAAVWMELRDESTVIVAELPGRDDPLVVSHPGRTAWWPDLTVEDGRIVIAWVEAIPADGFTVKMTHFAY